MTIPAELLAAFLAMGVASYLCRAGGYALMGRVSVTPRIEGALHAIPVALVGAILGPVVANGGPPEWAGLVAAVLAVRTIGNDFLATILAIAVVAGLRGMGM